LLTGCIANQHTRFVCDNCGAHHTVVTSSTTPTKSPAGLNEIVSSKVARVTPETTAEKPLVKTVEKTPVRTAVKTPEKKTTKVSQPVVKKEYRGPVESVPIKSQPPRTTEVVKALPQVPVVAMPMPNPENERPEAIKVENRMPNAPMREPEAPPRKVEAPPRKIDMPAATKIIELNEKPMVERPAVERPAVERPAVERPTLEKSAPVAKEKPVETSSGGGIVFGRSENFDTITGQVQIFRKVHRLRYAPVEQEDIFGGVVILEGADDFNVLKDGQTVRIRGALIPPSDRSSPARYRVQSIMVLEQ
jgi:hypothetical protein